MSDIMPKAIKVTVEYDNGLEVQSIGEHAQAFMEAADFPYPGFLPTWNRLERIPEKGGGNVIEGIVISPPREKED